VLVVAGADAVDVTPSALVALAGTVEKLAETVSSGRQAGSQVQLGTAAYGQLCQRLPALINPVQDRAIAAMNDASEALRESADALRTAAQVFGGFDRGAADRLDTLGRQP
jgi:uncharacterized protein YukE